MNEAGAHPLLSWKVQVPFWVCTLIWGTTWFVIRGQLGVVPPSWSVTYRFLIAGCVMFAYAGLTGRPLALPRCAHVLAVLFGLAQFAFNFNFVYRAEAHITSGLVALIFALLIVPNTIFSRLFLGQRATVRFYIGSTVAMAGIALLFVNEFRASEGSENVALGLVLTLLGVLSASAANVMQASERIRGLPMASFLAWGMIWGALMDGAWAWITTGPPVVEWTPVYLGGVLYLSIAASAVAFMCYFSVIRLIGPGPAAYSSIVTPVIAMAISTAFEGYRWTVFSVAGGVLAMAGLVIAMMARRPAVKSG